MRIRSIKPEWLEDERMVLASPEARVMSIALILLADDEGRGRANATMLGSRVFPSSSNPRDVSTNALRELANLRFVLVYTVDGQSYYQIRNWRKHQRIDRPSKSQIPEAPENDNCNPPESLDSRSFDEHSSSPRRILVEPSSAERKGKEEERKGKEEEKEGSSPPAPKPKKSSRVDVALTDERVIRILAEYRRTHGKDDRWKGDAKEDGKPRALIVLDLLEGNGRDQLTEAEVIAAIRGNKSDDWHAKVGKHELSYVLRADKVHGFITLGRPGASQSPRRGGMARAGTAEDFAAEAGFWEFLDDNEPETRKEAANVEPTH